MRGLDNLGNTCYMNSSLQALYATKPFRDYILKKANCSKELHTATKKLFKQMNDIDSKTSVEPKNFWQVFTKTKSEFQDRLQHDSQEFLSFMINCIHEEVNAAKERRKDRPKDEPKDSETAWNRFVKYEDDSPLVDVFVGQLRSTIGCTECRYESLSWEGFWDISVPLPDKSECTVEDCIRILLANEVLDSDSMLFCPKCKQKRKFSKKIDLERLPKVLIVHLKRFANDGQKKHTKVTVNEQILLGRARYSVYSCISHFGYSCSSGHYVCHCKHKNKWYGFDDEDVSPLEDNNLNAFTDPYIVFYQRI